MSVITRARASALLFGGTALSSIRLPGRAQTKATIHVETSPIEPGAEVYYAKDMGFFEKAGLDAEIQTIQGSSKTLAAMASNTVDIGYGTLDNLALLHQKNASVVVIAPAVEYLSQTGGRSVALIVPANSPVHQAKDLNGKIIAVSARHNLTETGARVWIDHNGGDSSTATFVEVPFPMMPSALDAGRADAAWVAQAFISLALRNGRALTYGYDGISKEFLASAWFTTPQWASDHPDLVKRFATAMHDTAVWTNDNQFQSGQILQKYIKIDPAAIATMTRSHYAEQFMPALMQPLIDVSAKYNGFNTFPAQELIYTPR